MKRAISITRNAGAEGQALLADVDWGALTPEEMSVLTVPSEDWLQAATAAARFERKGCYDQARAYWQVAAARTPLSLDRQWCEARALWCDRQLSLSAG